MAADPQREKVYAAEALAGRGEQLHSAEGVRAYVASLTGSAWWLGQGWPPEVGCYVGGTPRKAWGGWGACKGFHVKFPDTISPGDEWPWAWCEQVIVHELAHVTIAADRESPLDTRYEWGGHGPKFAGRYMELARAVGLDSAMLRLAFDLHDVAYAEPCIPRPAEPLGPVALDSASMLAASVQGS